MIKTLYSSFLIKLKVVWERELVLAENWKRLVSPELMGARWLWKLGGQVNKTGWTQYKSGGGAPMVKIKDFTLASQNLGGTRAPPVPYPSRAPMPELQFILVQGLDQTTVNELLGNLDYTFCEKWNWKLKKKIESEVCLTVSHLYSILDSNKPVWHGLYK